MCSNTKPTTTQNLNKMTRKSLKITVGIEREEKRLYTKILMTNHNWEDINGQYATIISRKLLKLNEKIQRYI